MDQSTTREGEGTGIGLALTHELIKLFNGSISVKSKLEKGTEFTVLLPVSNQAPMSDEDISKPIVKDRVRPFTRKPDDSQLTNTQSNQDLPHLLIIEDNADVVQYLISCLDGSYKIDVANNGKVGVEKAIEMVPDIIISDLMMPLMDGLEVCKTLKKDERTSHIPIIMLTAKATIEDRIAGLEQGADAYLSKPFDKIELAVRLRKLLELRTMLQKRYGAVDFKPSKVQKEQTIEDVFLQKVHQSNH